jgi:hypothetical protein
MATITVIVMNPTLSLYDLRGKYKIMSHQRQAVIDQAIDALVEYSTQLHDHFDEFSLEMIVFPEIIAEIFKKAAECDFALAKSFHKVVQAGTDSNLDLNDLGDERLVRCATIIRDIRERLQDYVNEVNIFQEVLIQVSNRVIEDLLQQHLTELAKKELTKNEEDAYRKRQLLSIHASPGSLALAGLILGFAAIIYVHRAQKH